MSLKTAWALLFIVQKARAWPAVQPTHTVTDTCAWLACTAGRGRACSTRPAQVPAN